VKDLSTGRFVEIIDDQVADAAKVTKVIVCSGKIYYDLLEKKEKDQINNVALVRMEQLYPFPSDQLTRLKERYKNAKDWVWLQEEPVNMGAWSFILRMTNGIIPFRVISRPESASPATGSYKAHEREQKGLLEEAFMPFRN
jgi:2-oxoglutarate dehydrogenase E1 component